MDRAAPLFVSNSEFAPADIESLFTRSFTDAEGPEEGATIGRLVRDLMRTTPEADLYGFVASTDEGPIGGIFFSRMKFNSPASVFLLSPVAVLTRHQGQYVGQGLINHGIETLRNQGVSALFTYGDPNYYSRVGFSHVEETEVAAPYSLSQPIGWLFQSLDGTGTADLAGTPACVEAFQNPEIW